MLMVCMCQPFLRFLVILSYLRPAFAGFFFVCRFMSLRTRKEYMQQQIVRLPGVKSRTGLSRSSIYAAVKEGTFPAPISLGARAVGWLDSSITEWIEQRISASRKSVG